MISFSPPSAQFIISSKLLLKTGISLGAEKKNGILWGEIWIFNKIVIEFIQFLAELRARAWAEPHC